MGIIWYVRDDKNLRLFELGKGWHGGSLDHGSLPDILDCQKPVTVEQLSAAIDRLWPKSRFNAESTRLLHRFCEEASWQVRMRCDASDSDLEEDEALPTVASMYLRARLDPDPLGGDWSLHAHAAP